MLYLFKASSEIGGILMISVPTEPSVVVSVVDDDSSRLPRLTADAVEGRGVPQWMLTLDPRVVVPRVGTRIGETTPSGGCLVNGWER